MKCKLENWQGFTIIELILALSITAIIVALLGPFLHNHLRSNNQAIEDVMVQEQAQAAMNLFMRKAMETKGIVMISLPSDPLPYIVKLQENDDTELIFSFDPNQPIGLKLKWGITAATYPVAGMITEFNVLPMDNDGHPVDGYHLYQASMANVEITVSGTDTEILATPKVVKLTNSLRFRNFTYASP